MDQFAQLIEELPGKTESVRTRKLLVPPVSRPRCDYEPGGVNMASNCDEVGDRKLGSPGELQILDKTLFRAAS